MPQVVKPTGHACPRQGGLEVVVIEARSGERVPGRVREDEAVGAVAREVLKVAVEQGGH
jgi:hypothetical protein